MASTSETGHAQNAANFSVLITNVKGYGEKYKPSNSAITVQALQTVSIAANEADKVVTSTEGIVRNLIKARKSVFAPLSKFITRVFNGLKSSGVSSGMVETVNTPVRKIQGKRAGEKLNEEELKALSSKGKEAKQISVSQMGINNRIENFKKLNDLLATIPEYTPNEEDIQLVSLRSRVADLESKNNAVIEAENNLSNAKIVRNDIFYKETTGLYDLANTVKDYVKSVYGATSPQYKQISKIKFTKPR